MPEKLTVTFLEEVKGYRKYEVSALRPHHRRLIWNYLNNTPEIATAVVGRILIKVKFHLKEDGSLSKNSDELVKKAVRRAFKPGPT